MSWPFLITIFYTKVGLLWFFICSFVGNTLFLGVNCEGLILIKPEDKLVLYEFQYPEIESIFLDPSDSFLTINLIRHHNDNGSQKCFVFETAQKNEIGSLIISYYPALASWITENEISVSWSQTTSIFYTLEISFNFLLFF